MTDYSEERAQELEVLKSIYPDEISMIADGYFRLRVHLEAPGRPEPVIAHLVVLYTAKYPDEAPELVIELDDTDDKLLITDEDKPALLQKLEAIVSENIGMAMIFSIVEGLKEAGTELLEFKRKRATQLEEERQNALYEARPNGSKFRGTPVTRETFMQWRKKFEAEMAALASNANEEEQTGTLLRLKKQEVKLTGKQLFELDKSLATSDEMIDLQENISSISV
ncbi:RWD domain-containing protein 1 [Neolecta irregularis DAH-3]|uniref:RWD domain-containing protein 1 n=1 Tax=Neolecta irregularis (strain DAH-3) TaxID=1198029 RepID=A0A1U7LPQ1_NEOID|nr:RWD domain-containing protein 1 [Neolecta irregularis DAH-3]|eukprot:OLL24646.1 RWD domain-containing protein 1 [Neolecta irregularis DAH-3]